MTHVLISIEVAPRFLSICDNAFISGHGLPAPRYRPETIDYTAAHAFGVERTTLWHRLYDTLGECGGIVRLNHNAIEFGHELF